MNLLCKQIGLSTDNETIKANHGLISRILLRLRGYSDNGPIRIDAPGRLPEELDPEADKDYEVFLAALNTLSNHKIIAFKPVYLNRKRPGKNMYRDFSIFVTNRYELERLKAELKWLGEPKSERSHSPATVNILYYDISTGEMFFNGLHKTLAKRNKKLLDALFLASPNSVPRKKLLTIARSESKYAHEPSKTVVTEAFTNLRKVCGVSGADAIKLAGDGKLNAHIYPLKSQLPPPDFITD